MFNLGIAYGAKVGRKLRLVVPIRTTNEGEVHWYDHVNGSFGQRLMQSL